MKTRIVAIVVKSLGQQKQGEEFDPDLIEYEKITCNTVEEAVLTCIEEDLDHAIRIEEEYKTKEGIWLYKDAINGYDIYDDMKNRNEVSEQIVELVEG